MYCPSVIVSVSEMSSQERKAGRSLLSEEGRTMLSLSSWVHRRTSEVHVPAAPRGQSPDSRVPVSQMSLDPRLARESLQARAKHVTMEKSKE